jgi:hypothetical protein
MPRRVCSVCGGEDFDLTSWECKTCPKKERKNWDTPNGESGEPGEGPDEGNGEGEGEPEQGEGDGEGKGDGEGNGQGDGDPPPVVLIPGEYIELPDGTLCLVADVRMLKGAVFSADPDMLHVILLANGTRFVRLKSITLAQTERTALTDVGPGDFLFEGARQEVIINPELPILDGCEYAVVKLDGSGDIKGLTKEDAETVTKVIE